jgi:phosphatidylinositol alpha-1,6-mannosyltransferase
MKSVEKLRILLITRNYPPLVGGMERLMQRASEGMVEWADLTIVGPAGSAAFAPPGSRVHEAPPSMAGFLWGGTVAAARACRAKPYDLVLGGSGLISPVLRLLNKIFGVKTGLFIHGLDLVANNTIYQKAFIPCINSADLIIANSRNTRRLAIERGASVDRITVINPGTDLPDLEGIASREAFCARFSIYFEKIILFTGRITRRKGLSGFISQCLPHILDNVPGAGLVVVGDNPDDSLNKQGEAAEVMSLVERLALTDRVRFLGKLGDDELLAAYAAADVQVFPLIEVEGDVEGFGMVVIEAAACGTPTVAFDVGGVADAIAEDNGQLVKANDYSAFYEAVAHIIESDVFDEGACTMHARNYGWKSFNEKSRKALNDLSRLEAE